MSEENTSNLQQSARRLDAEFIRDQALAVGDVLNQSYVGGPSVRIYQPANYYSNLNFPVRQYTAHIDDRFVDQERIFDLTPVRSATLLYRAGDEGMVDAVLVLADEHAIALALQLELPADHFQPRPEDVPRQLRDDASALVRHVHLEAQEERQRARQEAKVRNGLEDFAQADL